MSETVGKCKCKGDVKLSKVSETKSIYRCTECGSIFPKKVEGRKN